MQNRQTIGTDMFYTTRNNKSDHPDLIMAAA
jgi:hypothetical protein